MTRELKGIYPAIVTPTDASGNINEDVQRELIERYIGVGVHGFYVLGGTGEGLFFTVEERKRFLEITVDQAAGRVGIMVHIGAFQLQDTLELARHAGDSGADAISSLPNSWFFNIDGDGLVEFYEQISNACDLPLLAYNIPQRTGVHLSASLMKRLLSIKNLVGLKHATGDICQMASMIDIAKGNITVFMGEDGFLLPALMYGAQGGIGGGYPIMPRYYVDIYNNFLEGNYEKARDIQLKGNKLDAVYDGGAFIAKNMELLRMLGFDCGYGRSPNRRLTDDQAKDFRTACEEINFPEAFADAW